MAITVKISDIQVAKSPEILVTYGLGSCVALMLYDPILKVGGMSHFMLPNSKTMRSKKPEAFADTALVLLEEKLRALGADLSHFQAKLVGGASMFTQIIPDPNQTMGARNIKSAQHLLSEQKIPIIAEDVGGSFGRSVFFHLETGDVRIRYVSREELVI